MGVSLGNVRTTPLHELLVAGDYSDTVMLPVAQVREHNEPCQSCQYWPTCAGGCRAIALAFTGDYRHYDPAKCAFFKGGYMARVDRGVSPMPSAPTSASATPATCHEKASPTPWRGHWRILGPTPRREPRDRATRAGGTASELQSTATTSRPGSERSSCTSCRATTPPYIAEKLAISDSTVRSHLRSIYQKAEVASRMELIELFRRRQGEPPTTA